MAFYRTTYRPASIATAVLFGVVAVTGPARIARADSPDVSPKGKGIVGGGLLGADAVTIVEALAHVRAGWAYAVGGAVGAAGGAVGGYFVEKNNVDGKVPMYMLAGGLALIIPAVVLTLNATRYIPEDGYTEDRAPVGPTPEPGVPGGSIVVPPPAPAAPPPPPAPMGPPTSLLDVHTGATGAVRVGVPVPDVRPVFSVAEQRQYGLHSQETELRMPVLHVAF